MASLVERRPDGAGRRMMRLQAKKQNARLTASPCKRSLDGACFTSPTPFQAPHNEGGPMKRVARIASALLAALLMSGAAQAQLFRAYLSVSGNDAGPCTVASPCRLLPAAVNAVAAYGEIWILDSANYNAGTVNITKSVSILAVPGAVGSFVASAGGPALTVTDASVNLRNVVIMNNALSWGGDGVQVSNGFLDLAESQISAPLSGITATNSTVHVHHSIFRESNSAIVSYGSSTVEVSSSHFSSLSNAGLF